MAMFQPFKPTHRALPSKLTEAAYEQARLDQEAKTRENAIRTGNQRTAIGLTGALLKDFSKPETVVGEYLRKWTGIDDPDPGEVTEAAAETPVTPEGEGDSVLTKNVVPGESVTANIGVNPVTPPTTPPNGVIDQTASADSQDPDSINAILNREVDNSGMFADVGTGENMDGTGNIADLTTGSPDMVADATDVTQDATQVAENLTDAVQATEGATEAGEAVADASGLGSSMIPGVGTVAALAEGDVGSAAAKFALGMLPPPYNMLAMLV